VRSIYSSTDDEGIGGQHTLLAMSRQCPNVQKLNLRHDGMRGQWDKCLVALTAAFPQLTELRLSNIRLSVQGFASALSHCKCLESLEMSGPFHKSSTTVICEEIALPTLKSLKIHTQYWSDAILIAVGQNCAQLETLILFQSIVYVNSQQVTDVGVRAVLEGCPLLRETDVQYALYISHDLRIELAKRSRLTYFDSQDWWGMERPVLEVLKVSPTLRELHLQNCDWLTDADLAVCAVHCPLLETLVLSDCPRVTNAGVRALVTGLASTLRTVHLSCYQLGDDSVYAIAAHCPLLEHFTSFRRISATALAKLSECCVNLNRKRNN
jgi:hypothetical protein